MFATEEYEHKAAGIHDENIGETELVVNHIFDFVVKCSF